MSAQDGGADGRREWCLRKLAAQAHGWANGPAHDGGADTSLAERCLRKMAAQTLGWCLRKTVAQTHWLLESIVMRSKSSSVALRCTCLRLALR